MNKQNIVIDMFTNIIMLNIFPIVTRTYYEFFFNQHKITLLSITNKDCEKSQFYFIFLFYLKHNNNFIKYYVFQIRL